jgi:hypothetical protein
MISGGMLNVVMLSVVRLNIIMLSVMAPMGHFVTLKLQLTHSVHALFGEVIMLHGSTPIDKLQLTG